MWLMELKEWEVKQSQRLGSKCSGERKLGKAWRKTTTTSLCKLGSVCLQPCVCWNVEEGNMPLFDTNLRIILELLTIFVWHNHLTFQILPGEWRWEKRIINQLGSIVWISLQSKMHVIAITDVADIDLRLCHSAVLFFNLLIASDSVPLLGINWKTLMRWSSPITQFPLVPCPYKIQSSSLQRLNAAPQHCHDLSSFPCLCCSYWLKCPLLPHPLTSKHLQKALQGLVPSGITWSFLVLLSLPSLAPSSHPHVQAYETDHHTTNILPVWPLSRFSSH